MRKKLPCKYSNTVPRPVAGDGCNKADRRATQIKLQNKLNSKLAAL